MTKIDIRLDRADVQLAISEYLHNTFAIDVAASKIRFKTVEDGRNEYGTSLEAFYRND